ncbi:MAG: hypothetical protein FJY67_10270 [Calditrichaeota bacterium]|nr:hypothetical protein [Calditrichota bacterium]
MSPRTNLSLAALVLLAALTLFAAPGEAMAVPFSAIVNDDDGDQGVSLTVITCDQFGAILDEVPMVLDDVIGNQAFYEVDFAPDAASVTWEVVATPTTRFNPSTIQDGDNVNFQNPNVLDVEFDLL